MGQKIVFSIFIFLIFSGCSCRSGEEDGRVVAQINKYKMKAEDLKYDLNNIQYDEEKLLDTEDGRKGYVSRLIEKEILLQEAQRLGIDKEKDFMRSIENHWEQALLRILLDRKSREISGLTHVYDNEIEEYYRDSGETLPLSKIRVEIKRALSRQKETEAMNAWIEELKERSYIKIDQDAIEEIFSARQ
jgi:hypothetical protein